MDGMLSQEEINALLGGVDDTGQEESSSDAEMSSSGAAVSDRKSVV